MLFRIPILYPILITIQSRAGKVPVNKIEGQGTGKVVWFQFTLQKNWGEVLFGLPESLCCAETISKLPLGHGYKEL